MGDQAAALRPTIGIALYGELQHDRRVQREAWALRDAGFDVTIASLGTSPAPEIGPGIRSRAWQPPHASVVPGSDSPFRPGEGGTATGRRRGRIGWLTSYVGNLRSWGRWAVSVAGPCDAWHAVDLTGLAALGLAGLPPHSTIVYDSHELFLESGSAVRMPRIARWGMGQIEGRLARTAAGVVTVNDSIAEELRARYGVEPVVVMNCPPYQETRRPGIMRRLLGLGSRPTLLHHGSMSEGRGIRRTVELLDLLPDDVALVLLGDGPLVPWITEALRRPGLDGRLHWHPAVAPDQLMDWVVDADVGVMVFEPTELNFIYATPNRLFDCLMAGVPVVASDFPEFRRVVVGSGVGSVCDPGDSAGIARALKALIADPDARQRIGDRGREAARATYSWETQSQRLIDLYRTVLPRPAERDG